MTTLQPGWIKAIWLEPIPGTYRYMLRRFSRGNERCASSSYHDTWLTIGEHGADYAAERDPEGMPLSGDLWPHEDPRWPVKCASCGYFFTDQDHWQMSAHQLLERSDGGGRCTLRDAPLGSIWHAPWMAEYDEYRGPDGRSLWARCPDGHDWGIDSRARNCDSPCKTCSVPYHAHRGTGGHQYVDARPHKCWVRHGTPPELHVDKAGVTCGAGAGSIDTGKWHGFLHQGYFRA
jgi:hypothetical protein